MESAKSNIDGHQHVIVMRHGDRIDHFEPLWISSAERPWDPPLVHDGKVRAFQTGQRIRSQIRFPVDRVFVSPFLRCIQTAVGVIAGLSSVDSDHNAMSSQDVPSIRNSKLKVAIEFGLCEILNTVAIKSEVVPKDEKFDFNISDLEAMFPEGTVDHNVDMAYKELPQWGESAEGFKERYANTLKVLAEKYPSENLLLITHWGGVSATLYKYFKDATKYLVDYCGCVELRRQILNKDGFGETVEFKVVTIFQGRQSPNPRSCYKPICDLACFVYEYLVSGLFDSMKPQIRFMFSNFPSYTLHFTNTSKTHTVHALNWEGNYIGKRLIM